MSGLATTVQDDPQDQECAEHVDIESVNVFCVKLSSCRKRRS